MGHPAAPSPGLVLLHLHSQSTPGLCYPLSKEMPLGFSPARWMGRAGGGVVRGTDPFSPTAFTHFLPSAGLSDTCQCTYLDTSFP